MRRDLQNDIIGAKYLQVEKSVYYMDCEIFSLEVPVKEHGKPEIVDANNEIENLKTYETFEEVLDEGQETTGSRWNITEKQKHDGIMKEKLRMEDMTELPNEGTCPMVSKDKKICQEEEIKMPNINNRKNGESDKS